MKKEEAEKYLKNIIFDEDTQLGQYLKVNNKNGCIRCIKQITGCDDNICEDIYFDLYSIVYEKMQKEIERRTHSGSNILHLPTCPICGSTNLTKLSNVGKAAKVGFFGIFGAGDLGKTWKCKNCGSKF